MSARFEGGDQLARDLVDRPSTVDRAQDAARPVVVDDRLEWRQLLRHPGPDRRLLVIVALHELGPVDVAGSRSLWWRRDEVVDVPIRSADPTARHALDE